MSGKICKPDSPTSSVTEPETGWGSWEDAERWRKQSFLRRTPAQRLSWLEEMMELSRVAKSSNRGGG